MTNGEAKVHKICKDEEPEWYSDQIVVWKALVEVDEEVNELYITSSADVYDEAFKHLSRLDTVEPYILPAMNDNNQKGYRHE